jgi:hypothetical protein
VQSVLRGASQLARRYPDSIKSKGENVHHLLGARRVVGVLSVFLLSACSSGGDGNGNGSTHTGVSTNSITFAVDAPDAPTPAAQSVTATFGGDVAHLGVIHTGDAVANVTSSVAGRTAQIVIEPNAPNSLGSGIFDGAVAVTGYFCADAACSSLAAGNTQTIVVEYQISPVIQTVAPYVATADVSGSVIIRGVGFGSFAAQGVTFGTTPATEFALISDTEIRAVHPALTAGTYEVSVDFPAHEGDIESTAQLVVVEPADYTAETLSYPASVSSVRELIYDAERAALIVATNAAGGTILRYPFTSGVWGAAESVGVDSLRDIAFSTTGTAILALSDESIARVDPATLEVGTAIEATDLPENSFLKNLEVSNDDRALITTGIDASSATPIYIFTNRRSTLDQTGTTLNNGTPGFSADGRIIILIQGHPSQTSNLPVFGFSSTSNQIDDTGIDLRQNDVPPLLSRTGNRVVLNGLNVYGLNEANNQFGLLGTLPTTTVAVAVNSTGTRAYTYDSDADAILTFNISTDEDGDDYPQLGSAVALAGDPGSGIRMAISPDNNTLFLAGNSQIAIQPTPDP